MERSKEIERSIITKYRKLIWSRFLKGCKEFELVNEGDNVAVCISGGKDSMLLAKCMQELQRHSPVKFGLKFLVMDPGYNPANRKLIERNAEILGIPAEIFRERYFRGGGGRSGKIRAICARACAAAFCTTARKRWVATRSR